MSDMPLECLQTHQEFRSIRDDWDEFMDRCFPENYAKSHAWLSAFWETHHAGQLALIYIQRAPGGGKIVAAAPLVIKKENFGGFRVRLLQALGRGIGCDDFLLGPDAHQTVQAVFADLDSRQAWDVTMLRRVSHTRFQNELMAASQAMDCNTEIVASTEHLVNLPQTYQEYLASRTSKFRNNLKNATKRLEMEGVVSVKILSPFSQSDQALTLCEKVAKKSWQFKSGKSHFNTYSSSSFYANLSKTGRGTGGEEFVVLLLGNMPVAFMLGCKRGRTYHLVDTAYNEEYRNISVGRVLLCKTIERLIENGDVDCFNLEGDGEYKNHYANEAMTAHQVTIYRRSVYGHCIRFIRRTALYHFLKKLRERRNDCSEYTKH